MISPLDKVRQGKVHVHIQHSQRLYLLVAGSRKFNIGIFSIRIGEDGESARGRNRSYQVLLQAPYSYILHLSVHERKKIFFMDTTCTLGGKEVRG